MVVDRALSESEHAAASRNETYPVGLCMPIGISVPPFFQGYDALMETPPQLRSYFSVPLASQDRWINHHEVAIHGPVVHRDVEDPTILHVYLLSYERHRLIGHHVVGTGVTSGMARESTAHDRLTCYFPIDVSLVASDRN